MVAKIHNPLPHRRSGQFFARELESKSPPNLYDFWPLLDHYSACWNHNTVNEKPSCVTHFLLDALIVTNFTIVGHSDAEKPLSRILYANSVPDSEDTQLGKMANLTHGRSVVFRSASDLPVILPQSEGSPEFARRPAFDDCATLDGCARSSECARRGAYATVI